MVGTAARSGAWATVDGGFGVGATTWRSRQPVQADRLPAPRDHPKMPGEHDDADDGADEDPLGPFFWQVDTRSPTDRTSGAGIAAGAGRWPSGGRSTSCPSPPSRVAVAAGDPHRAVLARGPDAAHGRRHRRAADALERGEQLLHRAEARVGLLRHAADDRLLERRRRVDVRVHRREAEGPPRSRAP